ncbi:hypothetical protein F9802_01180 [Bacillus aerolatus]|uniref:Uncharacterized protein n=1 Tax=Bacillus aerolatus TaxID=2653354 RepID=A0A6I1FQ26_9BACI|nr:hypothetical protein [Bacillus aerolatus]KAB7708792.1 hypothetical protein F9802_01180 [Bacillus aerolatus]
MCNRGEVVLEDNIKKIVADGVVVHHFEVVVHEFGSGVRHLGTVVHEFGGVVYHLGMVVHEFGALFIILNKLFILMVTNKKTGFQIVNGSRF